MQHSFFCSNCDFPSKKEKNIDTLRLELAAKGRISINVRTKKKKKKEDKRIHRCVESWWSARRIFQRKWAIDCFVSILFCTADIPFRNRWEKRVRWVKGFEEHDDTCADKKTFYSIHKEVPHCWSYHFRRCPSTRSLLRCFEIQGMRQSRSVTLPLAFTARFSAFRRVATRHKAYWCSPAVQCYSLNLFIYEDIVNSSAGSCLPLYVESVVYRKLAVQDVPKLTTRARVRRSMKFPSSSEKQVNRLIDESSRTFVHAVISIYLRREFKTSTIHTSTPLISSCGLD